MKHLKKLAFPALCAAVSAIWLAVLLTRRDLIIINNSLKHYVILRNLALASLAMAIVGLALVAMFIARKLREPEPVEIPEAPGERPLGEDDRQALYKELADFGCRKWSGMDGIGHLLAQLDSMNEYQEQLDPLLEQTRYLSQKPAEIVQRVEDCMYVNIKKLLNYMRVVQNKSRDVMAEKIRECEEKNADLLKKTDDFVIAVVGYVNGDLAPGEEDKTKDYVDTYMYVVLQAIELPETYLK